jgi:Protein of unknown function (DUF3822)
MSSEPSFQICSPAFTIDDIGGYTLHIKLSQAALQLVVFQKSDLMVLEEYTFDKKSNIQDCIPQYQEIIDEHTFLKANYWDAVHVCTDSPLLYPISKDIFDEKQIPSYEKLIFQEQLSASYTRYETATTVFLMAFETEIQTFIEKIYPAKSVQIASTSFKMAKYFNQKPDTNTTNIHFSENHFTAYFWIGEQFIIENVAFNTISEKILKDKFKSENCILYGQITTFNPIYNKLKANFSNLSFGTLPPDLKTPSFMAELPAYRYVSLLV